MNKIEQLATLRIVILRARSIYATRDEAGETKAKIDVWRIYNRWLCAMKKERVRAHTCAGLIFENIESHIHYVWLLGFDPTIPKRQNRTYKGSEIVHNSPKNS